MARVDSDKPETSTVAYTGKIDCLKRSGTLAASATAKGFRHALR